MKTATLAALAVATLATAAHADTFATAGVKGDSQGRTILTTGACELPLDAAKLGTTKGNLTNMRRAFYYMSDGSTEEGCWRHDAGTVLLAWPASNLLRRWPIKNFKLEAAAVGPTWDTLR